jgi:hypothetical protein
VAVVPACEKLLGENATLCLFGKSGIKTHLSNAREILEGWGLWVVKPSSPSSAFRAARSRGQGRLRALGAGGAAALRHAAVDTAAGARLPQVAARRAAGRLGLESGAEPGEVPTRGGKSPFFVPV